MTTTFPSVVDPAVSENDTNSILKTLEIYSCCGKKLCVIFDMHIFSDITHCRYGSEIDRFRMHETFTNIGFSVILVCNATRKEVLDKIIEVKKTCILEDIQCLVTIILSHGNNENKIATTDSNLNGGVEMDIFSDFVKSFTENNNIDIDKNVKASVHDTEEANTSVTRDKVFMEGKPKLFIIQACRGMNFVRAYPKETSRTKKKCKLDPCYIKDSSEEEKKKEPPTDVDTLIAYSTLFGISCPRIFDSGTPYIFLLSKVFQACYLKYDVVTMLTIVNQLATKINIVIDAEEKAADNTVKIIPVNVKLLPCFRSNLTKKLFLSAHSSEQFELSETLVKMSLPQDEYFFSTLKLTANEFICGPKDNRNQDNGKQESTSKSRKVCLFFNYDNSYGKIKSLFENKLGFEKVIEIMEKDDINNFLPNSSKSCLGITKEIMCLTVIVITNNKYATVLIEGKTIPIPDQIMKSFINCKELMEVPKIFIIQSLGEVLQNHYIDECSAGKCLVYSGSKFIPTATKRLYSLEAGVLIVYSTEFERNDKNDFFTTFHDVFDSEYKHRDIVSMLTILNSKIAKKRRKQIEARAGKMSSWFVSRLNGLFYFTNNNSTAMQEYETDSHQIEDASFVKSNMCIIFNQTHCGPCQKENDDCQRIAMVFKNCKFDVKIFTNETSSRIQKILQQISDHSISNKAKCLVVIVLSHGKDSKLWATDGFYPIQNLITPFTRNNCPHLVGKPKIFLIQACRGDVLSLNRKMKVEANIDDNMLFACVMTPGFCSNFEKISGSVFIREMCTVIEQELTNHPNLSQNCIVKDVKLMLLDLKRMCHKKKYNLYLDDSKFKFNLSWTVSGSQYTVSSIDLEDNCPLTQTDDFNIWCKKFEKKCKLDNISEEELPSEYFARAGIPCFTKLKELCSFSNLNHTKLSYEEIKPLLLKHVSTSENVILKRVCFFDTNQHESEAPKAYLTRLREAAKCCEFEQLKISESIEDELVIQQLIAGIHLNAELKHQLEQYTQNETNLYINDVVAFIEKISQKPEDCELIGSTTKSDELQQSLEICSKCGKNWHENQICKHVKVIQM